jgi:hypothetical protein
VLPLRALAHTLESKKNQKRKEKIRQTRFTSLLILWRCTSKETKCTKTKYTFSRRKRYAQSPMHAEHPPKQTYFVRFRNEMKKNYRNVIYGCSHFHMHPREAHTKNCFLYIVAFFFQLEDKIDFFLFSLSFFWKELWITCDFVFCLFSREGKMLWVASLIRFKQRK